MSTLKHLGANGAAFLYQRLSIYALLLNNKSVAKLYVAVGYGCQFCVVGYYDEGLAKFVAQIEEQPMKLCFVLRIETARRLVSKDYGRSVHKGARYCNSLFFTTRKLCWLMVGTFRQSHKLQEFFCSGFRRFH